MVRSSGRRVGRLRSRSRSPERAPISSRNRRHDHGSDYDRRHGVDSIFYQTYSYPATDEGDDRTEPRHFLSRFSPDAEERRRAFRHSAHSLSPTNFRVTSWKWSGHHDYYGDDISNQYLGEGYRDQIDSGIGGSQLCRDYSCTSQLDPYQL